MPHCVVEYSDNIADKVEFKNLLAQINQYLTSTKLFNLNDIKSRAIKHSNYVIGDGESIRAFVTANLFIRSGREEAVRKQLSDGVLKLLENSFPLALKKQKTSLTVQITEMDWNCYGRIKSYDD